MSSRALRKAMKDEELTALAPGSDENEVEVRSGPSNMFDLLNAGGDDVSDGEVPSDERTSGKETAAGEVESKKKKKRRKNKKKPKTVPSETDEDLLEKYVSEAVEASSSDATCAPHPATLLAVESKYLYPEDELKRKIGAKINTVPKKSRARGAQSARLVRVKGNWPPFAKAGLSMALDRTDALGYHHFSFEHSPVYQAAQFAFLEGVESGSPDHFFEIIQESPYHIDSLLIMSDIVAAQDDQQAARDLVERALYGCECAFHPLFNIAKPTRRIDYKQAENRPFFLALFKHIMLISKRGCHRTALEFSKFLFSLSPNDDPLAMMLLIDFLALKSDECDYVIRFYKFYEPFKNLSLLPNWVYSYALATFLRDGEEAARPLLENAILLFPSFVPELLDKISVEPDPKVERHSFYRSAKFEKETTGLRQLISLYVARTHPIWKEEETLRFLERSMHNLLEQVDAEKLNTELSEARRLRQSRYHGTPSNLIRHVFLSNMQGDVPDLPQDTVLNYDPLPPEDSTRRYTIPERTRLRSEERLLSMFLRSLMPNFNPEDDVPPEPDGQRLNLQRSVQDLLVAVRDLLGNVQPAPPPIENEHRDDDDDADAEWE